jgi:MFS family permease
MGKGYYSLFVASALRLPGVTPYALGRLVSVLGRTMLSTALGWQLYERTHSPLALGLVGLAQVVPVVGLVTVAGAAADRYPRKHIGALTQLLQAAVALGIALVSYTQAPVAIIYALLFVSGIGTAFASPAVSALMPELVPHARLAEVNAWTSTAFQLASTAGPALAGVLLAALGDATPIYVVAAVTALAFSIIVWRLPTRASMPTGKAPTRRDLLAGLRFVFRCKELLASITLDLFAVLLGGVSALMPIFARDILQVGPEGLGWLQAAPSTGALLTAMVQTRLGPWRRSGHILLISVAGFGAATLGFGLSRSFSLSLALLFLTGVFDSLSVVIRRTLEQVVTPDRLRGRVGAVHFVFIGLSNELGEFESGVTAALLGATGSVLLGGAGTLVVVLLAGLGWPAMRRMGRLDQMQPREDLAAQVLGEAPVSAPPAPT